MCLLVAFYVEKVPKQLTDICFVTVACFFTVRVKHDCDAVEKKRKLKPKRKRAEMEQVPYNENSDPEDY